jgi:hypothetical protein
MTEKETNSIVKFDSRFIERIETQISITKKLLDANRTFDYITWWRELDIFWQNKFKMELNIQMLMLRLKHVKSNHHSLAATTSKLSDEEVTVLNDLEEYIEQDKEIELPVLIHLVGTRRMLIGGKELYDIKDLSPLKMFYELEDLQFINAQIDSITPLMDLDKLKILAFKNCKINQNEIDQFKSKNPNCIISQSDD